METINAFKLNGEIKYAPHFDTKGDGQKVSFLLFQTTKSGNTDYTNAFQIESGKEDIVEKIRHLFDGEQKQVRLTISGKLSIKNVKKVDGTYFHYLYLYATGFDDIEISEEDLLLSKKQQEEKDKQTAKENKGYTTLKELANKPKPDDDDLPF